MAELTFTPLPDAAPSAASSKPLTFTPAEPPGFVGGMRHAIAERGMGLAQFLAHVRSALGPGSGLPEVEHEVGQFEHEYAQKRAAGGPSAATRAGEITGGLVGDVALTAPLMAVPGGAAGFLGAVARGAGIGGAAGAITGAAQPVSDTQHYAARKGEQIGVGATTGAIVGAPLGALGRALARNDPQAAAEVIRSSYYRGIRPGTTMTAPQRNVYDNQVRQAVDAIIDARGGRPLPASPEEFSQAIAEGKASTFDRYSAMARDAEAAGARVELQPAADRLTALANDKLQDPAATNEAKRLLAMIPGRNATITPTRAEEVMRFLNERATGFEEQGTKGAGSVFREAAGKLRESLISAVESKGFGDYGKLRRTYGALLALEDDVGRAAGRELSRASPFGLSEIGAAGLAGAGEPVSAATVEGGKLLTRWWRSPNRAISKMFDEAAALRRPPSATERVGAVLPAAGPAASAAAARVPAGMIEVPPNLVDLRNRIAKARQDAAAGQIPP